MRGLTRRQKNDESGIARFYPKRRTFGNERKAVDLIGRLRGKAYIKKPFESTGEANDTSANIYMSMLMSAAWKDLTARQQVLYIYCKAQYYGEKTKSNPHKGINSLSFTMSQSKWRELYGLYKVNDEKSFRRDMAALIEKGFVICLECGKNTRTKAVYAFTDMWQRYGSVAFKVERSGWTLHMLNEEKRRQTETATN